MRHMGYHKLKSMEIMSVSHETWEDRKSASYVKMHYR